jgi:hypothetical protein
MDWVQKPRDSECYKPSSEPVTSYVEKYCLLVCVCDKMVENKRRGSNKLYFVFV